MKNLLRSFFVTTLVCLLSLSFCYAEFSPTKTKEFSLRTGLSFGTYRGDQVDAGTFNSEVNLQGEVWLYSSPQRALIFNANLSHESALGRTRYFGAGIGQRFFLFSEGLVSEQKTGSDFIYIKPNWSYYFGWDATLGQFLVVPFTTTLASYSTIGSVGATAGVKKIFNSDLSASFQVSYGFGTNVLSSTSVTVSRAMVYGGVSYAF